MIDLEDMGSYMKKAKEQQANLRKGEPKEMITPALRKSLTKQVRDLSHRAGISITKESLWLSQNLRL